MHLKMIAKTNVLKMLKWITFFNMGKVIHVSASTNDIDMEVYFKPQFKPRIFQTMTGKTC